MKKNETLRVKINCPVCDTSNRFELRSNAPAVCVDCGFVLALHLHLAGPSCVFCGGERFYRESPFGLAFLGRELICYLCEAEYGQAANFAAAAKFDQSVADRMQKSTQAELWRARADSWH